MILCGGHGRMQPWCSGGRICGLLDANDCSCPPSEPVETLLAAATRHAVCARGARQPRHYLRLTEQQRHENYDHCHRWKERPYHIERDARCGQRHVLRSHRPAATPQHVAPPLLRDLSWTGGVRVVHRPGHIILPLWPICCMLSPDDPVAGKFTTSLSGRSSRTGRTLFRRPASRAMSDSGEWSSGSYRYLPRRNRCLIRGATRQMVRRLSTLRIRNQVPRERSGVRRDVGNRMTSV